MTNGEKFKQIFSITQVDEGELYAFAWLPNHDAAEFSIDWWNAEYKEPTTKNDLGVDCISRQAVIDLMMQKWGENFSGDDAMQESMDDIRALPSVTPQEPKIGYWIDTNDDGFVYHRIYKCSHCGATVCEYPEDMHESKYKYCSTCGVKMVEPQESEE